MSSPILNAEQQVAVSAREGVWVCIAGPGSGKTRVIVERFKALLESGVPLNEIVSLTFTDAAAKEMGERGGFGSSQTLFRTFHSFCLNILNKERGLLPFAREGSPILGTQPEIFEVVCEILNSHRQRGLTYKAIVEGVSEYKRKAISPERAIEEAIGEEFFLAHAYADYEKKSRERGWLDFDSLILEVVKLLQSNEDVRARYQFRFVQADEGQDTDVNQFNLLKLLTEKHKNIFIVGDENQLIYEWRSALPGSLTSFSRMFPNAKTLYLGTNYRSTKAIVDFVKKIIPVDNGLASHMHPGPESLEGYPPTFTRYRDEIEEMEKVLASVTDPEHTAIIARTNRQLWAFENLCLRQNVKYRLPGKTGFWDLDEVKRVVTMVRERKYGHAPTAAAAVKRAIDGSGILQNYRVQVKFGDKDPAENINAVYQAAVRLGNVTTDEFLRYVQRAQYGHRNRTGLILSTVHQMKGKEADHVFLIGVCQGILPHDKGELTEERRIFFVAASRACKRLNISYFGLPSMFILPFLDESKPFHEQQREIPGTQHVLFEEKI